MHFEKVAFQKKKKKKPIKDERILYYNSSYSEFGLKSTLENLIFHVPSYFQISFRDIKRSHFFLY